MEKLIALCLLLPACLSAAPKLSETPTVAVFEAKKNIPHASVRIPALLMTTKGTLIAVAEGRDKATDQAGNDLLVATSKDHGKAWSKPAIAYEQGNDSCNNPCLVQDTKSGRVFLFFQTFPAGGKEFSGLPVGPKDPKGNRLLYVTSDDDGATWSKPVDVSEALKPDNAVTCASGPGIGIQIHRGKFAGRGFLCARHAGSGQPHTAAADHDHLGRRLVHLGCVCGRASGRGRGGHRARDQSRHVQVLA